MNNYDFLVNKLPYCMQTENNLKFYQIISDMFDTYDSKFDEIKKQHLLDFTAGDFMDDLGQLVGVVRNGKVDSEYLPLIKTEYFKLTLIPTLDNVFGFTKKFSGVYPVVDCLNEGGDITENAYMKFTYTLEPGFDITYIENLDEVVGAGIRLESIFNQLFYSRNYVSGTVSSGSSRFKRYKKYKMVEV